MLHGQRLEIAHRMWMKGYLTREMAEVLGITLKSLRTRLRAVRKLDPSKFPPRTGWTRQRMGDFERFVRPAA